MRGRRKRQPAPTPSSTHPSSIPVFRRELRKKPEWSPWSDISPSRPNFWGGGREGPPLWSKHLWWKQKGLLGVSVCLFTCLLLSLVDTVLYHRLASNLLPSQKWPWILNLSVSNSQVLVLQPVPPHLATRISFSTCFLNQKESQVNDRMQFELRDFPNEFLYWA